MSPGYRQVVFDVSTLARSGGQAVGIVRVARELARWARRHRDDIVFAIYDSERGAFRRIAPRSVDAIIDGTAVVDLSEQPDRERARPRLADRVPRPLRRVALWLRNPRRRVYLALERCRLRDRGTLSSLAQRMQSVFLSPKLAAELVDRSGNRRALLPFDVAAGDVLELEARDLLVCAGSDWSASTLRHIEQAKSVAKFRIAFLCYDTIPLMYPQFYLPPAAQAFRTMFHRVMHAADILLVTAAKVKADVTAYCRDNALPVPAIRIVPLGANIEIPAGRVASLPQGLAPGRYALFVSTIEPRKGHKLLLSVWTRLVAAGVPAASGFKLVFVGRRGWLVDDLVAEIDAHPSLGKDLIVLSGVPDTVLTELYRNAAFCLFPSLYEGYGLPAVEAFAFGKAVIASTGGALPEVVGDFSPCLDPRDEDAWFETMRNWIADPAARAPFETAIRERFRHPTWSEAAELFFAAVDAELASPAAAGTTA